MGENTNYCYKGSTQFVIENGILKGVEEPYLTEHNNFGEYILQQLKATPEFIGQIDGITGKEESFATMMEKSVKCALWLKEQNVQIGDIVGVCTHNQMDMYVPFFASLYLGAVFNPWWNTGITKEMAKYFLTLTCPKILFADEATANIIIEAAKEIDMTLKIIVFGNLPGLQSLDEILTTRDSKIIAEFKCTRLSSNSHPAILSYTSGSTGLPKATLLSHRWEFRNVHSCAAVSKTEGTPIVLFFSTLAWGAAIAGILRAAVKRETRIVYPVFSEEISFQLIKKFKVNWMYLTLSALNRFAKLQAKMKHDLSSLKHLYVVGSVLNKENHKALEMIFPQTNVCQFYGSTELGLICYQYGKHPTPGSCGTIAPNMQLKVIDTESGKILGPNQKGEAYVKSTAMMSCYYKNPEDTSDIIDAQGWLHTGDLVHYDEEGNLYITDRIKAMIKYRGNHVSAAMIEQVLQGHPAVVEAGVVAVPDKMGDEHPIAFVVKKPDAQVSTEELQQLVTAKLPDHMRLRGGIKFLEELPHTPSGKISKSLLKNMARRGIAS